MAAEMKMPAICDSIGALEHAKTSLVSRLE
jgi:hypothetical protein